MAGGAGPPPQPCTGMPWKGDLTTPFLPCSVIWGQFYLVSGNLGLPVCVMGSTSLRLWCVRSQCSLARRQFYQWVWASVSHL